MLEHRKGREVGRAGAPKTASASGDPGHGTYVVEFRTAAGEALAISIPRTECAVIRHFQERMPYGLFLPDLNKP